VLDINVAYTSLGHVITYYYWSRWI